MDNQEDMPPPNKSDSTTKFIELITSFANGMSECYPDCPQINATSSKVKLVCSTSLTVDVLIEKWFDYLQTPLSSNVKYARAVERILQKRNEPFLQTCTMYHAFVYGDVKVALEGENPIEEYIDLNAKMADPTFDQESKDAALKYIRALNDCVFECKGHHPPYCPSRSELSEEIKLHKENKKPSQNGRLSEALGSALNELANEAEGEGGDEALINDIRTGTNKDWVNEWHMAMLQTTPHGKTLYDLCTSNDFDSMQYADPSGLLGGLQIHALVNHSDVDKRNKSRELVSHINVLTQVHSNVPSQMRGKIEAAAEQLAGQIMAGNLDMSSIDLNQIGQDVLDGCDSEDLSSLAENIGSLLPVLSKGVPPELAQRANPMLQMLNNQ